MTTFKRLFTPEKETIKLAEFKKGESAKFLENEYKVFHAARNPFDKYTVTLHKLESSKSSSKEMAELASHPYLFPSLCPRNKFINRVITPILDENDFIMYPRFETFKRRSSISGRFDGSTVYVNKINQHGLSP